MMNSMDARSYAAPAKAPGAIPEVFRRFRSGGAGKGMPGAQGGRLRRARRFNFQQAPAC
jgi:hypothetical protein